jgi:hypothetical protein
MLPPYGRFFPKLGTPDSIPPAARKLKLDKGFGFSGGRRGINTMGKNEIVSRDA